MRSFKRMDHFDNTGKGIILPDFQPLKHQKMKIVEFANSVDPDEVAQNEPPYLVLHCLPSSF